MEKQITQKREKETKNNAITACLISSHDTTTSVGSVLGKLLFSFLCCSPEGVTHRLSHSGLLV